MVKEILSAMYRRNAKLRGRSPVLLFYPKERGQHMCCPPNIYLPSSTTDTG